MFLSSDWLVTSPYFDYWVLPSCRRQKNKKLFRKELNNIETKFSEGERKLNSLENKLQLKCKESKQAIRNLNRKPMKTTKSDHRKARLIKQKMIQEKLMRQLKN